MTPENLMFYNSVQLYRQTDADWARRALIGEILELYIRENGRWQVNINHQMRSQLLRKIDDDMQAAVQDTHVFDAVLREVTNLVQTNDMQRCLQTMNEMQHALVRTKA